MALADADAVEAVARRLAAAAEQTSRCASRLQGAARDVQWRGPAADAFRAALGDDAAELRGTARALEQAAAEMRRHAATVRERVAALKALEAAAARAAEQAAEAVAGAADDLADGAADLVRRLP